ncbi:NAD-dependent succinate-semialdehyde dehydrogenase [Sphingobacterium sp. lm-10]|uniref:NAD-dependent succinate-semialdehyde dehydrogenase n=1 Tax=Sphingobacterium sp. lm-10 TaxID=2944904 RepID=UPI0020215338|nr:NAD-dependent succinate-semialdehyde dehydrogenase [Sphingobacterium sp. lm-10]MCL7987101.1 NAD-dependent succinate-semialdehyde dehydrogenase [Sphingobacterium sp. lm-10]
MSKSTFKITNPYTEQIEKEYPYHTVEDSLQMLDKAHEAFHSVWKNKEVSDREKFLIKAADILQSRKAEIAKLAGIEMGKPLTSSESEIDYCIQILKYYGENSARFLKNQSVPEIEHGEAYLTHEPLGVLLSVQPWNFPFSQLIRFAAPNIAAGNTVLMKPTTSVYQCALAIQKVFDDAGLPDGVYNTFVIDTDEIEALVSNKRVRGVMLTGSEKAGASIAALAGKYIKKSVLELGGSDPFIVLENADLDKATKGIIQGRLENSGQVCTSSKRIIVVESVYEEIKEKVKEAIAKVKIGDPLDPETEFGPMSSEAQMDTVLKQIKQTKENGGTLISGGTRLDQTGFFIAPTLFSDVKKGQPAYDEEIFGPVISLIKVKDDEEAVKVANDSHFGLGSTIFCEDISHAKQIAKQIDAGMVFINRPTTSSPQLPFGGVKNSGYGRELSWLALTEFSNQKLVRVSNIDADY